MGIEAALGTYSREGLQGELFQIQVTKRVVSGKRRESVRTPMRCSAFTIRSSVADRIRLVPLSKANFRRQYSPPPQSFHRRASSSPCFEADGLLGQCEDTQFSLILVSIMVEIEY